MILKKFNDKVRIKENNTSWEKVHGDPKKLTNTKKLIKNVYIRHQKIYSDFIDDLKAAFPKFSNHIEFRRNILIPGLKNELGDDVIESSRDSKDPTKDSERITSFILNTWKDYLQGVLETNMLQAEGGLEHTTFFIMYILLEATVTPTVRDSKLDEKTFLDKYPEHFYTEYVEYWEEISKLEKIDENLDLLELFDKVFALITHRFNLNVPVIAQFKESGHRQLNWIISMIKDLGVIDYEEQVKLALVLLKSFYYSWRANLSMSNPESPDSDLTPSEKLKAASAKRGNKAIDCLFAIDDFDNRYFKHLVKTTFGDAGNYVGKPAEFVQELEKQLRSNETRNVAQKKLNDYHKTNIFEDDVISAFSVNLIDWSQSLVKPNYFTVYVYLVYYYAVKISS